MDNLSLLDIKKITNYSTRCHDLAKQAGWWDNPKPESTTIMLMVGEAFEALESLRTNKIASEYDLDIVSEKINTTYFKETFKDIIKDTFGDELADVVIRIYDANGWIGYEYFSSQIYDIEEIELIFGEYKDYPTGLYELLHKINHSNIVQYLYYFIVYVAQNENINLKKHIKLKLLYNQTRPKMHGKQF